MTRRLVPVHDTTYTTIYITHNTHIHNTGSQSVMKDGNKVTTYKCLLNAEDVNISNHT